jgi:hypothetical protein
MTITFVCGWCGSSDVSRDAWADWDVEKQEWVLRQVFDDGFCQTCERLRGLEEVEL